MPFRSLQSLAALLLTALLLLPAAAQLDLANGLYARGMFNLAAPEYQKIVDAQPDHPHLDLLLYRLGNAYQKSGDDIGAKATFARLKLRFPDSPFLARSNIRSAETLLREKKYLEALKVAEETLKQPDLDGDLKASALFQAGIARAAIKHAEEALTYFQTIIREHPTSPYQPLAAVEAARILQARGQLNDAAALYRTAAERPPTPAIGAEALYQLGNLAFDAKDFPRASLYFAKLLETYPEAERAHKSRLRAAWALHNQKDYYAAAAALEAMPRKDRFENAAEYTYLKANAYRQLRADDPGAHDVAVAAYERLVAIAPDVPFLENARYELLLLYAEAKQHVNVLDHTPALIQSASHKHDALWLQARAQRELGLADGAADTYSQIVRDFPTDPRAPDALYTAAQETRKTKNLPGTAALFGQFAASFPDHPLAPTALFNQGDALEKAGQSAAAARIWKTLADTHPDHGLVTRALFGTAVQQYRDGDKPGAADAFARIIKTQPDAPLANESRYYLAALQDELSQPAAAEATYRDLLRRNPSPDRAADAQLRLGLNLYNQEKFDAAAGFITPILSTPVDATLPPELILWLAQHHFDSSTPNGPALALQAASLATHDATPPRLRQVAWLLRGQSESRLDNTASAITSLQAAVDVPVESPERVDAALKLGDLQRVAGQFPAARKSYTLAAESAAPLQLFPRQARAIQQLGLIARSEKKWDEAATRFMSVAVLFDDPTLTPEALGLAIDSFRRADKPADANKAIAELRDRYPDSPQAKRFQ